MKISASMINIPQKDDVFEYAKSCGWDALEPLLAEYFGKGKALENASDTQIKEFFTDLKAKADKAGIEILQTIAEFDGYLQSDTPDLKKIIDTQIKCIKATSYLGAKYCVINPPVLPERKYDRLEKENFELAVEFFKALIPALEEFDVYCCIENIYAKDEKRDHLCPTICSEPYELVALCNALGERFKICFNVGHSLIAKIQPKDFVKELSGKLAVLHLNDNNGYEDSHDYPYVKSIVYNPYVFLNYKAFKMEWHPFLEALCDIGYDGDLSFDVTIPGPAVLHRAGFEYLAGIGRHFAQLIEQGFGKE